MLSIAPQLMFVVSLITGGGMGILSLIAALRSRGLAAFYGSSVGIAASVAIVSMAAAAMYRQELGAVCAAPGVVCLTFTALAVTIVAGRFIVRLDIWLYRQAVKLAHASYAWWRSLPVNRKGAHRAAM